jgi:ectoine hydroxylase
VTRLTEVERASWARDGFVVVPGALTATEADTLHAATWARYRAAGEPTGITFTELPVFQYDQCFRDVIDNRAVIGRVVDLMGEDIQVMSTQHMIRFPSAAGHAGWHADGMSTSDGYSGYPLAVESTSLLQLKVLYALHDLTDEGSGVTRVVPGSHRRPNRAVQDEQGEPEGAIPVLLGKGDAVLFHQALWHSPGNVLRDEPRVTLFYAYNYLWARPYDYDSVDDATLELMNPVQRRLLQPHPPGPPSRFYSPSATSLRALLGIDRA